MSNLADLDVTERAVHDSACPGMAAVRALNLSRSVERTRRELKLASGAIEKTHENFSKITSKLVDEHLALLGMTVKLERELAQQRQDAIQIKKDLDQTKAELSKFVASPTLPELGPFGASPPLSLCVENPSNEDPIAGDVTKSGGGNSD